MDYEALIELLRNDNECDVLDYIEDAATAIEDLLAERNAAVKELRHFGCGACKHEDLAPLDPPCRHCYQAGGMGDYWEWRGRPKED